MKPAVALCVLLFVVSGCSDDTAGSTTTDGEGVSSILSAEEREWCSFDSTEESANRFDVIFEAGIALGLGSDMDAVNATAAARLSERLDEGMERDQAVRLVSEELLSIEAFQVACQAAYAERTG